MRVIFFILWMFAIPVVGQEYKEAIRKVDSLYREDQFYAGFTFNILLNRAPGIDQSGFSGGVHLGFIRDMPLNKQRNVALGLGLGYSGNTYNQNLAITGGSSGETRFTTLAQGSFDSNRFTTNLVEMPLEFRWRTSTPSVLKFYRLYVGMRLGYLHGFKARWVQDGDRIIRTTPMELERIRWATTFTFGWNTFNFHFYYSLNALFGKDTKLETQETVGLHPLKVGLLFYIL